MDRRNRGKPLLVVDRLYERWRVPWLYRFADKQSWDVIPDHVKKHPAEAKFIHKYAMDTPLHRLVRPLDIHQQASSEKTSSTSVSTAATSHTIKFEWFLVAAHSILTANPAAATLIDGGGSSPLHLSCTGNATRERIAVAQLLVQHTPRAARIQDLQGRTPLMVLLQDNPWMVIETARYEQGREPHDEDDDDLVEIVDDESQGERQISTPMSRVYQAGQDLIQNFIEADPDALERCNARGETALDLALQSYKQPENVFGNVSLAGWLRPLMHVRYRS